MEFTYLQEVSLEIYEINYSIPFILLIMIDEFVLSVGTTLTLLDLMKVSHDVCMITGNYILGYDIAMK